MSQNHFTLSFPLKSPADAKAAAEQLLTLMPGIFQAQGTEWSADDFLGSELGSIIVSKGPTET